MSIYLAALSLSFAVACNADVFASLGSDVFKLDAKTGTMKWIYRRHHTPKQHWPSVAKWPSVTKDGTRVFIQADKSIVALNATSGKVEWEHVDTRNICSKEWWTVGPEGDVTISNDDCFMHHPDFLYRLDGTNGMVKTNFTFSKTHLTPVADGKTVEQVAGQPLVSKVDQTVIIQHWPSNGVGGSLTALDGTTGILLWNFVGYETHGLVEDEDGTIFVSSGEHLVAIDKSSHGLKWKNGFIDLGKELSPRLSPPSLNLDGSTVFLGNCACCFSDPHGFGRSCTVNGCLGSIVAVNADRGNLIWARKMTANFCPQQLLPTAEGSVVAVVENVASIGPRAQLLAFDAQSGVSVWSHNLTGGTYTKFLMKSGSEHSVVLLNNGWKISSIDVKDGSIQWDFYGPGNVHLYT